MTGVYEIEEKIGKKGKFHIYLMTGVNEIVDQNILLGKKYGNG